MGVNTWPKHQVIQQHQQKRANPRQDYGYCEASVLLQAHAEDLRHEHAEDGGLLHALDPHCLYFCSVPSRIPAIHHRYHFNVELPRDALETYALVSLAAAPC